MDDPFVKKNNKAQSKGDRIVLEPTVATKIQKASDCNKKSPQTEVEIHHSPINVADPEEQGTDAGREVRLTSESTPVEQVHDLARSTGTLH